jgi:general L-amino acid transport system permease protein
LCRAPGAGACWAFIARKLPYFTYGSYPLDQRWRVDLTLFAGAPLIAWLLWLDAPFRRLAAILFFLVYPIFAFILLHGAPGLGLPRVDTNLWGGVFVSLLVAAVGIVCSLPLGVLLALGRRSSLPTLSLACAGFIEFVRGVPMITVLFMANTMLPLFVPESLAPDRLVRPLIGVALFASAYMAEVVRGGLQAIPRGQFEGASALGLRPWPTLRLVILPQALRHVIPGIVNSFISLFKDTTLVAIVGIFDFLRTVESARLDPAWAGPTISATGYIFAALFYFIFCFGMSRYSRFVERRLARGRGH